VIARILPPLAILLPFLTGPLAAQAGNLNLHMGARFDAGKRFPALGTELQLGPRPWFVKATAAGYVGFVSSGGTDYEGSLGLVWIRERSEAAFYPYLGAGGAVLARTFPWGTDARPAGYVHGGLLVRRGTNGNWGLDARFLSGPAHQVQGGVSQRTRYLQLTILVGFGW
jgi:hypothetical protein